MTELHEARNYIDGQWTDGEAEQVLQDKFTGEPVTVVHYASAAQVGQAAASVAAAQERIEWPASDRFSALSRAADLVTERQDELAALMVDDTGFTITDAATEVKRARQTLLLSAQAATTLAGEMVPMDAAPGVTSRLGYTIRTPIGVVGAITPFNSPLNTVAHKVAPALAAGNGVVLKPAELTPATPHALVRLLLEAGVPAGLLALVNGPGESTGEALIHSEDIGFLTFTGSTQVGRIIQGAAGLRPTQLELGSIASTIVCADADLPAAVRKTIAAGFRKAGQVCTSVQRLYVQRGAHDRFVQLLLDELSGRVAGDPRDAATFIGPMISVEAADRVASWVDAAVRGGAQLLAGGDRKGALYQPTVLTAVPADADVLTREVFGPLICLIPFDDLDEAVHGANDTPFGLAAGIFTTDLSTALRAARRLRFGGVHVNEASSSRIDLMPFGGVKCSGHGKEGPLYAAREMTEERLITISF
jgi:succinate-semialdehyde dehydrogenase/glutarate-semialdehyde dehydrogenase